MKYTDIYYAHSKKDKKELLIDHLRETGKLASEFAGSIGYERLGLQLGLIHDVGKHTKRFQKVLQNKLHKINHAVVAAECYADMANESICADEFIYLMICHCLNAHHSELRGNFKEIGKHGIYIRPKSFDDAESLTDDRDKQNALSSEREFSEVECFIEDNDLLLRLENSDYPDISSMTNAEKMLFVRMMQSCLVDADYSATATFEDSEYAKTLVDKKLNIDKMLRQLEDFHNQKVSESDPTNPINKLRNLVYQDAADAGKHGTQFYTLTAPTGTAKTLAMMRFALENAKANQKSKIIIVLPYLSITSQNTKVYQDIFGTDVVLEDDSTTMYPDELRIYADRWNSQIIVTTSVKFFETLQSAKASDLRRLHQIANSVVVFDESQTLASDLTDITVNTLRGLVKNFGVTVVFSTATQPSYRYRKALQDFTAEEIIKNTKQLYKDYEEAKKTSVKFSTDHDWTDDDIADYFENYKQAICVANTTGKALSLYQTFENRYGEGSCLYLSSRLCPDHKKAVIKEIDNRLKNDAPCYLLSTQCVEAGVDFDFPAGAREYAPLTSISQTAGRINRNGKRTQAEMLVYRSDRHGKYDFPSVDYRNSAVTTYHMACDKTRAYPLNTNCLQDIDTFYKKIFSGDNAEGHDKEEIQKAEKNCDIQSMAKEYRMIEDKNQCNVIVPYKERIDEFNTLAEKLSDSDYILSKKELFSHHGITVSVTATGKALSFIETHCNQLKLYSPILDAPVDVNWYIADMDNIYDPKTGLKTKENLEEGGMLDV